MKFKGINHLAMVTGDMDTTIRFWRDLLGMRLVGALGEPGFRHYFFEISPTDTIAFFEWEGAQSVGRKRHGVPIHGPIVFDHIAFGLESADDVWALKDRLEAADFECSDVVDHGFIHSIYTFDPNGIPIEFTCDIEEIDIRKNPFMVDAEPSPVALEGAEPQPDKWPEVTNATPVLERSVRPGAGSDLKKASGVD